ncbi:hypothetical protein [Neoroseomonas lacus]|uniref:Uncharacterized protein n=1 Tax=Neoroseomonas lacus TaxID=287609 RepID=A0A917KCC6_9PROT|nr:hypothetical protein [Neoroseomonas lacus]GGJ06732.1 hypothetical protein GCM10011320_12060 [Neoroseomonas lacus]
MAVAIALTCAALPAAAETLRTLQSGHERASENAPSRWRGSWSRLRDDERTRAGAPALRLAVRHDAVGPVEVPWVADRGIGGDPNAPLREWADPWGTARAVADGPRALAVLLCISAHADDPFPPVLDRRGNGKATARLVTEMGDPACRLDADRE